MSDQNIYPDALYSVRETAAHLGFRSTSDKANTNRVHEIAYEDLPRVKIGAKGGKVMFQGRDILAYIEAHRHTRRAS